MIYCDGYSTIECKIDQEHIKNFYSVAHSHHHLAFFGVNIIALACVCSASSFNKQNYIPLMLA